MTFDTVCVKESPIVHALWDFDRVFKCCSCLRLKVTFRNQEESNVRPLTTDHRYEARTHLFQKNANT